MKIDTSILPLTRQVCHSAAVPGDGWRVLSRVLSDNECLLRTHELRPSSWRGMAWRAPMHIRPVLINVK